MTLGRNGGMPDLPRLNLVVTFEMATGTPTIESDIKPEHWAEVLEGFLQLQIGKGADDSPPTDKPVYRIHLQVDLSDGDQFYSSHDCGNKGLRDGILVGTLGKVRAGLVKPTVQGAPNPG